MPVTFTLSVGNNLDVGSGNIADILEVQKALNDFSQEMPRAAVRAVNASMTGIKTDMSKAIRAQYNFSKTAIDKRLKVHKATISSMGGYVKSSGRAYHLTDMTTTKQNTKGVSVKIDKTTGTKTIPHAFIAPGQKSGKLIVFRRPGTEANPTDKGGMWAVKGLLRSSAKLEWFTVAHPEFLYNTKTVWPKISVAVKERVDKNIAKETDAELRRLAGAWNAGHY